MSCIDILSQILRASGHNLFYYTFSKKDEKDRAVYYEIDFLISSGSKIDPIEVKSSSIRSHKSLDEFGVKFSTKIGTKYIITTKPFKKEGDIWFIPIYMAPLLR